MHHSTRQSSFSYQSYSHLSSSRRRIHLPPSITLAQQLSTTSVLSSLLQGRRVVHCKLLATAPTSLHLAITLAHSAPAPAPWLLACNKTARALAFFHSHLCLSHRLVRTQSATRLRLNRPRVGALWTRADAAPFFNTTPQIVSRRAAHMAPDFGLSTACWAALLLCLHCAQAFYIPGKTRASCLAICNR